MEKLLEFLQLACTGTGQATFYNTAEEQGAALSDLHEQVCAADRRGYTLAAALPINDRNRQLIVKHLLSGPAAFPELEAAAVRRATASLPIHRLLDLCLELRQARLNNSRVRRLFAWVWERHGDAYRVIKYRRKFRIMLRHCHLPEGGDPAVAERHRFVFGQLRQASDVVHNPLLRTRLEALHDAEALWALPLEIARDLAVDHHGWDSQEFVKAFAERGRLSRAESLRARRTADAEIDFGVIGLLPLLRHVQARPEDGAAAEPYIARRAAALGAKLDLPARVAVVVDNSASAAGSAERRGQPLAVIEGLARAVMASGVEATVHSVGPELGPSPWPAAGGTDLRRPLAAALTARPDLVLVLSDGYENSGAGGVAQILATRAFRESGIRVVHLNPVAAAESAGPRRLADNLPAIGIGELDQAPLALLLARAWSDPQVLQNWLDRLEAELLRSGAKEGVEHVAA